MFKHVPTDVLWLCLDWVENPRFASGVFFFFLHAFVGLRLLFMHCAWTVATKFDFSPSSQSIRIHRVLFTDPQISLFNNFFIKTGSHGTIHTFKNYFATVFFSFQFQFSIFNCIQMDSISQGQDFQWRAGEV